MEKHCPLCGKKVEAVLSITINDGTAVHLECLCSRLDAGEKLTEEAIYRILNSPQTKLDQYIRTIERITEPVINELDGLSGILEKLSDIIEVFGIQYNTEEFKIISEANVAIAEANDKIKKLGLLSELKSENRKNRAEKIVNQKDNVITALREAELNY